MSEDVPYLTESKLVKFCIDLWPDDEYMTNRPIKELGKFRPDYVNLTKKIVVEYDGHRHYTQSKTVEDDKRKTKILQDAGYKVIRWPYFVQLESRTIYEYFGIDMEYEQTYPHGFISKSCVLPSDFCIGGLLRFEEDVGKIIDCMSIMKEVFGFIGLREELFGPRVVWPNSKDARKVFEFLNYMSDDDGNFEHNYS